MTDDPRPPVPPAAPEPPPELSIPQVPTSLVEHVRRRMETMERELAGERERARQAEGLLRQQEALRTEVDRQLKALLDQLKTEKTLRENAEEKSRARGRIDALESRLDQMHQTWAGLLKDALARKEAGDAALAKTSLAAAEGVRSLGDSLAALREDLRGLREEIGGTPAKILPRIQELQSQIPASVQRREEDERILADRLRDMISNFGTTLTDRLSEMDRRLALELERQQERLDALMRERALMTEALAEERHNVRQDYAKERQALQSQFDERLAELAQSLAAVRSQQEGSGREAAELRALVDKVHAVLTMPQAAKEQVIAELEQEKRDLMKALKDRCEQIRSYTLERREVERTLGESLMDLNRQLDRERERYQQLQSQVAGLNLLIQELQGSGELARKTAEAERARYGELAIEHDRLVAALVAEAQKVQARIAEKTAADESWEERLAHAERRAAQERQERLGAESQISNLRSQLQILTDHMASALRDKEKTDAQSAGWQKEREELLAVLRKKDEMIAMLSATFQGMLKK